MVFSWYSAPGFLSHLLEHRGVTRRLSAFCILHATFGLLIWALEYGVRLSYNTPR